MKGGLMHTCDALCQASHHIIMVFVVLGCNATLTAKVSFHGGKKIRLNRGSNSQPQGHESDTLITELARRGHTIMDKKYFVMKPT